MCVQDETGRKIPNARVAVWNNRTTVYDQSTGADRKASAPTALSSGTYEYSVEAPGFDKLQRDDFLYVPGRQTDCTVKVLLKRKPR